MRTSAAVTRTCHPGSLATTSAGACQQGARQGKANTTTASLSNTIGHSQHQRKIKASNGVDARGALLRCARLAGDRDVAEAASHGALRGDGSGADGGEDGVPGRAAGARVHGAVRAQNGEVRRKEEEAGRRGGEEGGVGLGLRELRGRVAAGDGGAVARAAAGGRPRGAPLHAPSRRPRAVQEALPAYALGLRVQRRPHRPLLPLARRPVRGCGGGGGRGEAEEWSAHKEMQVLGEQRVRRDVRQHVQDPHSELLHRRVRTSPHHESKF